MTVTPPAIFVGAVVIGLAVALSFWISPVIAIPLLVIGLAVVAVLGLGRARNEADPVQKEKRDRGELNKPDDHFTERDRETLVEP
jgi:hypothetical protein